MSLLAVQNASTPVERRAHPRRRLEQLAYIGFGPDAGGVLLDVSESGLRCQIVGAVNKGERCRLKFALPGRLAPVIEAEGQVVWSNASGQGGGVRLAGLSPDAHAALQQWIRDEGEPGRAVRPLPVPIGKRQIPSAYAPPTSAVESPEDVKRNGLTTGSDALPIASVAAAKINASIRATTSAVGQRRPPQPPSENRHGCNPPIAKKPAPQPGSPRPTVSRPIGQVFPLTSVQLETQKPRFGTIVVAVGCVLGGIAGLALSDFNPTSLLSALRASNGTSASAPATPAVPAVAAPTSSPLPHWAENGRPDVPESADHPSPGSAQAPRTEPSAIAAVPVSPPPQRSTPARAVTSRPMALAPPRPRADRLSPPAALPEVPLSQAAPAPLMDLPVPDAPASRPAQPISDYRPPQLLSQVEPVYSEFARQARLQGTVRVNATIGMDGVPRSAVCVAGNSTLCQMAVEALGKWRYQPATSGGAAVEAQVQVNFNFQLR